MDQRRVELNVPFVTISCRGGILCMITLQKRRTAAVECSYV